MQTHRSHHLPFKLYQIIILLACFVLKFMIDFDLARSMLCCWVWLILPRMGKAKLEADEIVQIWKQSEFCSCFLFLRIIDRL